jgi:two-component sensor histidine kinase
MPRRFVAVTDTIQKIERVTVIPHEQVNSNGTQSNSTASIRAYLSPVGSGPTKWLERQCKRKSPKASQAWESQEFRIHLVDAHQRVRSVASLQRQLAVSRLGDVQLRPYFIALCESIAAPMIRDREKISLTVRTDNSLTTADTSVSLGLIIIELVITRSSMHFRVTVLAIVVDYRARGPDWTLAISDNGVGFSQNPEHAKAGLGTSIVRALASQLNGRVQIASTGSGTRVTIVHSYTPFW